MAGEFPGFPSNSLHPCIRDSDLDTATRSVLRNSLAPASRRAYTNGQRQFYAFCELYGLRPVPATSDTLVYFVGHLRRRGVSGATARQYLAAVRHLHVQHDVPYAGTSSLMVSAAMRGASLRGPGHGARRRLPVTIGDLRVLKGKLCEVLPSYWDQRCVWAACTLAFYAGLRSGEYLPSETRRGLRRVDVTLDPRRQGCAVELCIQKTRQFGPPERRYLPATGTSTCPVNALSQYCEQRDRVHGSPNGPLFVLASGAPLNRRMLTKTLQQALGRGYSSHSLRIGLATTAAAAGVPDATIQLLGRWTSAAYGGYIQGQRGVVMAALRCVARHRSSQ